MNSNTNTNHLINLVHGSKPTAVLYTSLIPGYERNADQQIPEEVKHQLPNIEKISIFVNELYKQIDQHTIESSGKPTILGSSQRYINPDTFQLTLPSPNFSYGQFEHV